MIEIFFYKCTTVSELNHTIKNILNEEDLM